MMFVKRGLTFIPLLFLLFVNVNFVWGNTGGDKDPFKSLGIPDLNPKSLLEDLDNQESKQKESSSKKTPQLKTIDDLPKFLKDSSLNEEEGVKVLTRFLIQDDFTLKKYGVVYDQTGFDGIPSGEGIATLGTEERLSQRARSSSNLWFKNKFPKLEYDAYGAENIMDEIVPNWRIFKVLMIGKNGENTFIKVCLPLDESETALCSDKDEACGPRADYVEKEKKRNEDYINRIRSNNFFKKKSTVNTVKLLPGEKLIATEGDKKIVIDSSTLNNNFGNNNNGFYNPPSVDSLNGDALVRDYRTKNNLRGQGFMQGGMGYGGQQFEQTTLPNLKGGFGGMNLNNMYNMNNMGMNMNNIYPNSYMQQGGYLQQNINPSQFSFKESDLSSQNSLSHNHFPAPTADNKTSNQVISQQVPPLTPQKSTQILLNQTPTNSNPIDNTKILNDIMEMKNQLNQMMYSMKQKDEIINQQNMKLSQYTGYNSSNMNMNMFNNISGDSFGQNMSQIQNAPSNLGQNYPGQMINMNMNLNQMPLSRK